MNFSSVSDDLEQENIYSFFGAKNQFENKKQALSLCTIQHWLHPHFQLANQEAHSTCERPIICLDVLVHPRGSYCYLLSGVFIG